MQSHYNLYEVVARVSTSAIYIARRCRVLNEVAIALIKKARTELLKNWLTPRIKR